MMLYYHPQLNQFGLSGEGWDYVLTVALVPANSFGRRSLAQVSVLVDIDEHWALIGIL